MRKFIGLALIALIGLPFAYNSAMGASKKKKPTTEVVKKETKPISSYERLFRGKKVETARSKFLTLHKCDGKLYVEFPLQYMGRDMLIASTLSQTSDSYVGIIGYKPSDPMHVKFDKRDSLVRLILPNEYTTYDRNDEDLGIAVAKTSMAPIKKIYPIKAYTPDSTAVVIDMTEFFAKDNALLPVIPRGSGMISIKATPNPELCSLGQVKAFEDNAVIKTELGYNVSVSAFMGMISLYSDAPVSTLATRTILLLPEKPMNPRYTDSRVGIFLSQKRHISGTEDMIKPYAVAHRWRLEPKDVKAFERGELVEPVKPIVFYIDNAFPELWRAPLKEGIERWNKAFEKIGFKNAVHGVYFPENDPDFDPDNLKYSCIRYVPSETPNAMGPSWVDPRSGEIINGSVIIYSNITKLINNWRFVQTAQVDERVRAKKMPESIIKESMAYVVAHEIGHTLGFMHNMSASAAYPVDSLRSASFTSKYGTTSSIMDYARFNYVAQPGDKGVALTPPSLGEYDNFLIKWNYIYYPDQPGAEVESKRIDQFTDALAGSKVYHYGRQQVKLRVDPRSLEEDLGDDAIKAGDYGIKNLKYIFSNLDKWITEDYDGTHKEMLTEALMDQYCRYIQNVLMNVGGIYLDDVKEGTSGERFVVVPRKLQRESMLWAFKQMRDLSWLDNKNLKNKRRLSSNISLDVVKNLIPSFMDAPNKMVLASHVSDDPYTLPEFYNDIYTQVFASTIANRPLSNAEMFMQTEYITKFISLLNAEMEKSGASTKSLVEQAYGTKLNDVILYGLDETGFVHNYKNQLKSLKNQYGSDYLSERMGTESVEFGSGAGYGWQDYVLISTINNSKGHVLGMCKKVQTLLKSRIATADLESQAHYRKLLLSLNKVLKDM